MIRQRLVGVTALLGLAGIVIGVPFLLVVLGTVPSDFPNPVDLWGRLTRPDDGTFVLGLFAVIAWVAWTVITISVVIEAAALARRIPAPQLPGAAGLPQKLARGLLLTVVVAFAAATIAPTVAVAGPADSDAPAGPNPTTNSAPAAHPAGTGRANASAGSYTVREGDSLWSIAEQRLGDGERWPDLAHANYGVRQADGGHLTGDHVIRTGWTLRIPGPAKPVKATVAKSGPVRHVVKDGESLWTIAEQYLGNGDHWRDIYLASRNTTQPGGYQITDPDQISAGWTVTIPAKATQAPSTPAKAHPKPTAPTRSAEPPPAPPHAPQHDTDARQRQRQRQDESARQRQDVRDQRSADRHDTGHDTSTGHDQPGQTAPATAPTAQEPAHPSQVSDTGTDDHLLDQVPLRLPLLGVGAVLAAGLVAFIARRRRAQHRTRAAGHLIPMPTGPTAHVEQSLRAVADDLTVATVDTVLRQLSRHCHTTGIPLPAVRAARLTSDQFDVYLSVPAELPPPWAGTDDQLVWSIVAADITPDTDRDPDSPDAPAPYPSLVTLGHDSDDGLVLLDLEHIGTLGIHTDPDHSHAILTAMAAELALSPWADDLTVTIVGGLADLDQTLTTGRLRYLPTAARLADELRGRVATDQNLLRTANVTSPTDARARQVAPDTWNPHLVLLAAPLTAAQQAELMALVESIPRTAIAAVTTGPPLGDWYLTGDLAEAILHPTGLKLTPQSIDDDTYTAILDLLTTAHTDIADDTMDDPAETGAATDHNPETSQMAAVHQLNTFAAADEDPTNHSAGHPDGLTAVDDGNEGQAVASTVADVAAESDALVEPAATVAAEVAVPGDPDVGAGLTPPGDVSPRPYVRVLGVVDVGGATGKVESSKRARLLEYGAYLALNPATTWQAIDDAIWPGRTSEDNMTTRNTATSKLRRWMGADAAGAPWLPTGTYTFRDEVRTDWADFRALVGADPAKAATSDLVKAIDLVRGIPFAQRPRRRYAWAEPVQQEMLAVIVDAIYELAHRRFMAGEWQAAEQSLVAGLALEPGIERLWRLRILAAHQSRSRDREERAIEQLLDITDGLGSDLEPKTEDLLAALRSRADLATLKEAL